MRRRHKVFVITGLLLIAAALCLAVYNEQEARQAARTAEQALQELAVQMEQQAPTQSGEEPEAAPAVPEYLLNPHMEMPTQEVDGKQYIGVLEVPALSLELPVLSGWSYELLRAAPCRYTGSAYLNDLIIAAHNYKRHFGSIHSLTPGDEVIFTDMAGNRFFYTVAQVEQLPGTAVEEMESEDWDLTLFTCTIGGKARVTVRCELSGNDASSGGT